MGRTPGSQNKPKHSAIMPNIIPRQAQKAKPERPAPIYPPCPGCGGPLLDASLGRRCTNENCSNWHGVGAQKVTTGYRHDRFKVKELKSGEWDAHGRGAFKVIDYAM